MFAISIDQPHFSLDGGIEASLFWVEHRNTKAGLLAGNQGVRAVDPGGHVDFTNQDSGEDAQGCEGCDGDHPSKSSGPGATRCVVPVDFSQHRGKFGLFFRSFSALGKNFLFASWISKCEGRIRCGVCGVCFFRHGMWFWQTCKICCSSILPFRVISGGDVVASTTVEHPWGVRSPALIMTSIH